LLEEERKIDKFNYLNNNTKKKKYNYFPTDHIAHHSHKPNSGTLIIYEVPYSIYITFQILNRDKCIFKQQCQEKKNSPLIELKNNKPIKFNLIQGIDEMK